MKKITFIALSGILLSACVGQASLQKKTAWELGLEPNQVQISNISHGATETTYNAVIKGKKYNCSIIGGNALSLGMSMSPKCTPIGGGKTVGKCNVMLEMAGKCKN